MADLVFGKYEIQHRLAIGGMGEVFYALQRGVPGFERPVILKSLLPDLAKEAGFIEGFLDEARVAATLNHPNVVSIFEVGQWGGTYYLAMEYIRGRNLAQVLRRTLDQQQLVPPVVSARIIRDAALGLDHAHRATDSAGQPLHVVHRDISPQNIMVRDDGLTKVVDFGIARATNRASRTATGALKGKLAYMAPEQILGGDVGPGADQFALGIVLWEMLSHQRLFRADRDLDVVKKVLEDPIPPPMRIAGVPVPPELTATVMRMLQRNVDKRFASCADAAMALEAVTAKYASEADSPRAFMRTLGTDDLVIKVQATPSSAGNFVISLKDARPGSPPGPAHEVSVATATPIAGVSASRPRSRGPLVIGAVVVALVAAVVVGFALSGPQADVRDVPPVPPPIAQPPPPPDPSPVPTPPPDTIEAPNAPPALVKYDIVTTPPKAIVRFDGKPMGSTPLTLEVAPNTPHYLLIEKPGYRRIEQPLTAAPGDDQKLAFKLEAVQGSTTAPPPPPVSNEPGFLSLNTNPWTKVAVDGEPLGSTPVFRRKLSPGRHQLELVNEGAGISTKRTIDVKPGETLKLDLALK